MDEINVGRPRSPRHVSDGAIVLAPTKAGRWHHALALSADKYGAEQGYRRFLMLPNDAESNPDVLTLWEHDTVFELANISLKLLPSATTTNLGIVPSTGSICWYEDHWWFVVRHIQDDARLCTMFRATDGERMEVNGYNSNQALVWFNSWQLVSNAQQTDERVLYIYPPA